MVSCRNRLSKSHLYLISDFFDSLNGKVLYRFPCITSDANDILTSRIELLKIHFDFINTFETSNFQYDMFDDGPYHLNNCGREINTLRLLNEIKQQNLATEE